MLPKKSNHLLYLVDWDVPREPQSHRRAFYRYLEKLKLQMDLFGRMSTKSVLVTTDQRLAEKIYRLACQFGVANIYIAEKFNVDL